MECKGLILPTEKNSPPKRLEDSIITIYGRKGIGKTSLASQFQNSLTFMFESGRRNLRIMMVPEEGGPKLDWNTFLEYVGLAIESDRVSTLVVDTVDRAYDACLTEVCRRAGCKHPQDKNDWGKTWGEVKAEFAAVLQTIQDSGKGLILLSHETPKALTKSTTGFRREDSEKTFQYERMEPTCSKQAFEIIQEICDYVFYYGFREEFRSITVRSPNDLVWTSCGLADQFLDPDGNPLKCFKVGSSPEEAYANLVAAHRNEVFDIDYIPPRKKGN